MSAILRCGFPRRPRNGGRGARVHPARRRQGRTRPANRRGGNRAPRARRVDEEAILERNISARLRDLLNKKTVSKAVPEADLKPGGVLDAGLLKGMNCARLFRLAVDEADAMDRLERLHDQHFADLERIGKRFVDKCEKVRSGDDLQAGLIKVVKVFVAVKRKLQAGDKMAAAMATRGSSAACCRKRTCPSSRTELPWTSF